MAILMPRDTRQALGLDAANCESRSLRFDRFADPQAKEETRNKWFKGIAALKPSLIKCGAWSHWLAHPGLGRKPGEALFAQLQSRLMVNMAGGVMENAGLCLDRFGVPYIPGSAVKGCARHQAIQSLLEAREAGKPTADLARLLADIALVFGWGEQDWKMRPDIVSKLASKRDETDEVFTQRCQEIWKAKRSDFAYAVGDELWEEVATAARRRLPNTDHFAGTVSFLPAYPHHLPANDLELDIVTCHHPKYYRGDPDMPVALDIEEPNPVVFLTVAAGIVFQFATLPIRRAAASLVGQVSDLTVPGVSDSVDTPATGNPATRNELENMGSETPPTGRPEVCPTTARLLTRAREWLRQGLETFGLGGKTSAGYGWFECEQTTANMAGILAEQQKQRMLVLERASLQPDPVHLEKFAKLPPADLAGVVNQFSVEPRFWKPDNQASELSVLHYCTVVNPQICAATRANPKGKVFKALQNLAQKYNRTLP